MTIYPPIRPGERADGIAVGWKTYVYTLATLTCLAQVIEENLDAPLPAPTRSATGPVSAATTPGQRVQPARRRHREQRTAPPAPPPPPAAVAIPPGTRQGRASAGSRTRSHTKAASSISRLSE